MLVNWIFFQVSIAVLLDNFLAASNAMKVEKELSVLQTKQNKKQLKNPLNPLLLRLSKDYTNEADLSKRIRDLFSASKPASLTINTRFSVPFPVIYCHFANFP